LDVLAQVDVAGDCQVIQLEDSRDIWDSLLEIGDFLVVIAQLDEGCHGGEALRIEDEIDM
jgi:hypothetical protein